MPFSVREGNHRGYVCKVFNRSLRIDKLYSCPIGINIFLDGFVPTENLRFREESLVFKVAESATEEEVKRMTHYEYPTMKKNLGDFSLQVCRGQFTDSEILVLLGENGTGKTTFIKMLAGVLQPDDGSGELPRLNISYKPQKISPKSQCQVRQLLHDKIRDAYTHPQVGNYENNVHSEK